MDRPTSTVLAADVLAALAVHAFLKRYDPAPLSRTVAVLTIVPLLVASIGAGSPLSFSSKLVYDVAQTYAVFFAVLSFSVIAYRLSPFHPLAKHPGPAILKVTKLLSVWIAYKGTYHLYLKELHDKYGPTVRIGPNELSTVEKELIPEILGNPGMAKGPMWDARRFVQTKEEAKRPYRSIIDVRDPTLHGQLRKPWARSFAAEPMKSYEALLLPRVLQMNAHLEKAIQRNGNGVGHVDVAKWLGFFSFDFMGDLAFGTSFEMMRDGDPHGQHKAISHGFFIPGMVHHIPWFANVMRSVPMLHADVEKLINLGVSEGLKRSTKEVKHKDLFHYMGQTDDDSVNPLSIIIPNVVLAIVAGSDTSSSVMTNSVNLLVSHPEVYQRLQKEIDEVFNKYEIPGLDHDGDIENYSEPLAGMKYLNAVINEALRLFPAVPTALQRAPIDGSGGKLLQGDSNLNIFVPENTAVLIPAYVMHRDPRYFSPRPDDFIPERWLSDPSFKTTRDAFIPFSFGPRNCVGRPLALMELRYTVATLFRNFKLEFDTPKYDAVRWKKQILDRFTLENGTLDVKITVRTRKMRGLE